MSVFFVPIATYIQCQAAVPPGTRLQIDSESGEDLFEEDLLEQDLAELDIKDYVDRISAEEALMNVRIKGSCRGS